MRRQGSRPLVAALALAMGGGALAQSGRQLSLVAVHVAVERPTPMTDGSRVVPWTLVGGLGASDFEVVSDGAACRVESLSANTAPLSMAVLVDVSAGTGDHRRLAARPSAVRPGIGTEAGRPRGVRAVRRHSASRRPRVQQPAGRSEAGGACGSDAPARVRRLAAAIGARSRLGLRAREIRSGAARARHERRIRARRLARVGRGGTGSDHARIRGRTPRHHPAHRRPLGNTRSLDQAIRTPTPTRRGVRGG